MADEIGPRPGIRSEGIGIPTVKPKPTAKSMHAAGFDVSRYAQALALPNKELNETLDKMVAAIQGNEVLNEKSKLRILVIGTGEGRIEVPFVEKLRTNGKAVHADFVDYSRDSFDAVHANIVRKAGSADPDPHVNGKDHWHIGLDGSSYDVHLADFETWDPANDQKYDIILAFFVVNFFADWSGSFKKILQLLNPKGMLFYSEDTGDIRFVDNVFAPEQEKSPAAGRDSDLFRKFWKQYYAEREEEGFHWDPIISPANMKGLREILERLQELAYGKHEEIVEQSWISSGLSWNEWLGLVEGGASASDEVFNCLSCIPSHVRGKLKQSLHDKFEMNDPRLGSDGLNAKPQVTSGHRLYSFTLDINGDIDRKRIDYVIDAEYDRLVSERAAHRHPFRLDPSRLDTPFEDNVRRLMTVNELLPDRGTVAISPVSWRIKRIAEPGQGDWSKEVPVLLPEYMIFGGVEGDGRKKDEETIRQMFALSYGLYWCGMKATKEIGVEMPPVSEIILQKLRYKVPIEFQVTDSERAQIEVTSRGTPERIRLDLDRGKVQAIRVLASDLLASALNNKKVEETLKRVCNSSPGDTPNGVESCPGQIEFPKFPLVDLRHLSETIADALWGQFQIKIKGLYKCIMEKCGRLEGAFAQQLQELGVVEDREAAVEAANGLVAAAYMNTVIGAGTENAWEAALFVPARSFTLFKNKSRWHVGLLGFICYFTKLNETRSDDERNRHIRRYETLLLEKVNEYGLEDTIQQASGLVRKEAVNSAIAAILGRVNAHDLGHILTHAKSEGGKHFEWLTRYLRTRMVFAAEAANAVPTGAIGISLHSGLLDEFCWVTISSDQKDPSPVTKYIALSENVKNVTVVARRRKEDGTLEQLVSKNDVLVSVPYGYVGAHALYCILENVIRNGAKYGSDKSRGENMRIDLVLKDVENDPDRLAITVWDDRSKYTTKDSFYEGFSKICDYFPTAALPTGPCYAEIVRKKKQEREKEKEDRKRGENHVSPWALVDAEARLASGGFGIKEMRITAAWLGHERVADAMEREDTGESERGSEKKEHNIVLTPIVVDEYGKEPGDNGVDGRKAYFQGYRFFLMKPKPVVICDAGIANVEGKSKNLEERGVGVESEIGGLIARSARADLAIIADPEILKECKKTENRQVLPPVLISVGDGNGEQWTKNLSQNEYRDFVDRSSWLPVIKARWEWSEKYISSNVPTDSKLLIYLKPDWAGNSEAAASWMEAAVEINNALSAKVHIVCTADESSVVTASHVYDDHEEWSDNRRDSDRMKSVGQGFYVGCDKNDPTVLLMRNPPESKDVRMSALLDFLIAATTRIQLVDERISAVYSKMDDFEKGRWMYAGVHVSDLSKGGNERDWLTKYVNGELLSEMKANNSRLLVIHQGILDKAVGGGKDHVEKKLRELDDNHIMVIVVSDRGKELLPRLPRSARFLPFSTIQPWLGGYETPKKLLLVKSLLSARASG